ncbi:MAG: STAS domain-containing protein [Phycisphaerae bacterium]
MNIEVQKYGAVSLVQPAGPLVGDDARQCKAAIREAIKESLGRVVLDLSGVSYVDSVALESLLEMSEKLEESGRTLKLCAVNETVRQVLELTELAPRFEYFEDANVATRSFL